MKKIFIISTALTILSIIGYGQKLKESQVPAAAIASFMKKYPGAQAKWELEKGNYEAGFKKEGKQMSAVFQPDGLFLESEISILESEFPSAGLEYIKTNYKNLKVHGFAKITNINGIVTYEAEINGRDVIFDSNGKYLKELKD